MICPASLFLSIFDENLFPLLKNVVKNSAYIEMFCFMDKSSLPGMGLMPGKTYQILFVILFYFQPCKPAAQDVQVPYVATPPGVVDEMLNIANVESGDYVIDLGSGDGRIVIEAAKRGAVGHGIEIDADLVEQSFKNAETASVSDRVLFFEEDIFETDFSMASVVTIYLSNSINLRLRPLLFDKLKPGTRVVSHIFHMDDWQPDSQTAVNRHNIYKWIIPADVRGTWSWSTDDHEYEFTIIQKFQKITETDLERTHQQGAPEIVESAINGEKITVITRTENSTYVYNGIVSGDKITGNVQIHNGDDIRLENWSAKRTTTKL